MRAELKLRILETKAKLYDGEVSLPRAGSVSVVADAMSTPERRDGWKRTPYRGNTFVSEPPTGPTAPPSGTGPAIAPFPNDARDRDDTHISDPLTKSDP